MTRNNQGSAFSPRELASKVRSILSLLSIIDYNVLPLLLVINGGVLFLLFIIDCSCFYWATLIFTASNDFSKNAKFKTKF